MLLLPLTSVGIASCPWYLPLPFLVVTYSLSGCCFRTVIIFVFMTSSFFSFSSRMWSYEHQQYLHLLASCLSLTCTGVASFQLHCILSITAFVSFLLSRHHCPAKSQWPYWSLLMSLSCGWQCSHRPKVFAMHAISFLVWYPLFSDMGHHQVILVSFLVALLCCCQCCVSSISVNLLPKSSSKIITVDMWLDIFDCGSVAIDIACGLLSPYLVVDRSCRFHLSLSLLSSSGQC